MPMINVTGDRYTAESLYQWDKNQTLEIYGLSLPFIPQIHFTNSTLARAIVQPSTVDAAGVISVNIPNSLLTVATPITVYICEQTTTGFKSHYSLQIKVIGRTKPGDYTVETTDGEVYSFIALEALVYDKCAELEIQYNETANALRSEVTEIVNTASNEFDRKLEDFNNSYENLENFEANSERILGDVNNHLTYSTAEADSGQVWVDGKKIYRKVYDVTAGSTNFNTLTPTFEKLENCETVIRMYGMATASSGFKISLPGLYEQSSTAKAQMWIDSYNAPHVAFESTTFMFNRVVLVVEYTKTT